MEHRSPEDHLAAAVGDAAGFQQRDGYSLSAAEILAILSQFVAERAAGHENAAISYPGNSIGPSSPEVALENPVTVEGEQFLRTAADVADSIRVHGSVPSAVWLGSQPVPPAAFMRSLALVAIDIADGKPIAKTIEIKPARLASAKYVADDNPNFWKWVIFRPGFHAPHVMELAKREAWSLKPAILDVKE